MKKIKLPLFVLGMVIAIAGAFAATLPNGKEKTPIVYHYTSTSALLDDMQDIGNWEGVEANESCGSTGSIPCTFTYEGDFEQYLESFNNPVVLKNAADSRRTP